MKVTDHSKLTYPCYLKDQRDGMVVRADVYDEGCRCIRGTIVDIGTNNPDDVWFVGKRFNEYHVGAFSILCDAHGNEIDSQEEHKMTVEEAEEKIKELQKFIDSENNRLYSADELLSGKYKNGLYQHHANSCAYVISNADTHIFIDMFLTRIEKLNRNNDNTWKFVKPL